MLRFIQINRFAELSGYSEKAVRRKIEDGVWMEGREYRRAPDGRVLIDTEGYERWVSGTQPPLPLVTSRRKRP